MLKEFIQHFNRFAKKINSMKKITSLLILLSLSLGIAAQTSLTEAIDFYVKVINGDRVDLFPLLDEENKIVVMNFYTTS